MAAGRSDVEPTSLDVNVALAGGTDLIGTVARLRGDVLHTVTYSRLGPAARLIAWVRLLALTAAWPERSFEAATIGRARGGAARGTKVTTARIATLGGDLDLYRNNLREPLPLYCKTSAAWAEASYCNQPAEKPASAAWTSSYNYPRENKDTEHVLVLGGEVGFEEMVARSGAPRPDEVGDSWDVFEQTRFGRLARRLWDGLLDHEEVTDR